MTHNIDQATKLLEQIQERSFRLDSLAAKNNAHVSLWEEAHRAGDGVEEQKQRDTIHNLLDQSLDTRAEVLQLVKKFQQL